VHAVARVSFIIPFCDEEESLPPLWDELRATEDAEFLFVDDGSRDRSRAVLAAAVGGDPRVRMLALSRRSGKAAALAAGLASAGGAAVVFMDADLQDDPAETPGLLAALDGGLDLVCGWRRPRRDSRSKRLQSWLFNGAANLVSGLRLHDHNSSLKAARTEVLRALALEGGWHRMLAALAHAHGFRVGEVEVAHRPRRFGRSKYGVERALPALRDLVRFLLQRRTAESTRPLR
jgi:dolichol-phosphate mannosyltransferase